MNEAYETIKAATAGNLRDIVLLLEDLAWDETDYMISHDRPLWAQLRETDSAAADRIIDARMAIWAHDEMGKRDLRNELKASLSAAAEALIAANPGMVPTYN